MRSGEPSKIILFKDRREGISIGIEYFFAGMTLRWKEADEMERMLKKDGADVVHKVQGCKHTLYCRYKNSGGYIEVDREKAQVL